MDPNEALKIMRRIVREYKPSIWEEDERARRDIARDLDTMVDTFDGLDGWLEGGGSLPSDWSRMADARADQERMIRQRQIREIMQLLEPIGE